MINEEAGMFEEIIETRIRELDLQLMLWLETKRIELKLEIEILKLEKGE